MTTSIINHDLVEKKVNNDVVEKHDPWRKFSYSQIVLHVISKIYKLSHLINKFGFLIHNCLIFCLMMNSCKEFS